MDRSWIIGYPQDGEAWWRGVGRGLRLGTWENQRSFTWLSQLQFQAGVVSRQQALDAGFTEKAIKWRLRSGTWQRLYSAVYATFTGKPSREGRLWAAALHAGPGAVLSRETAAEIHGLTDKQSARIHVSVPAERRPGQHKKRCRTAAEIAAVLRGQGWTGTLRRCGPSCTATGTQRPQRPQG